MSGIQTSLQTLFFICAYVAICGLVYVHSNLWIGTIVVIATILWLIMVSLHAFRHHSYFSIGFSLFAWSWLVFWLGFYSETLASSMPAPTTWYSRELGAKVFNVMNFFREMPTYDPSRPTQVYGVMHSVRSEEH